MFALFGDTCDENTAGLDGAQVRATFYAANFRWCPRFTPTVPQVRARSVGANLGSNPLPTLPPPRPFRSELPAPRMEARCPSAATALERPWCYLAASFAPCPAA